MLPRHLDDVMAVEKKSFPSPWRRSAFAGHLQHPEFARYFVALKGRKAIGYAGMFFAGDYGQITNIAVSPRWRRRGVGTRLLQALLAFAAGVAVNVVSLEVRVSNKPAQELYSRFGFIFVGKRRGYYQDTGEDAYIMCLNLRNKLPEQEEGDKWL